MSGRVGLPVQRHELRLHEHEHDWQFSAMLKFCSCKPCHHGKKLLEFLGALVSRFGREKDPINSKG